MIYAFFMRERYTYNVVRGAYIGYMDGHIFFIELSEYDEKYHKITYTQNWMNLFLDL